jgi:hypothetical protein
MTDFNEHEGDLLPTEPEAEEQMSMTLSGIGRGEGLPESPELEAESSSGAGLLSHSAVLIAVVAVIAIGSLYMMRATQGDLSASEEAQQIEAKITNTLDRLNKPSLLLDDDPLLAENLSNLLASTDDVTAIFGHDVREQQVPIEEVKKDPFSMSAQDTGNQNTSVDTTRKDSDKQLIKLRNELKKIRLQSIMMGARNIAVIDGEFCKMGDRVGRFTVTGIDKLTVYLESGGNSFELSLDSSNP